VSFADAQVFDLATDLEMDGVTRPNSSTVRLDLELFVSGNYYLLITD